MNRCDKCYWAMTCVEPPDADEDYQCKKYASDENDCAIGIEGEEPEPLSADEARQNVIDAGGF